MTRLYRDDISYEESGALVWYLRNRLYFDLELERDDRVILVKYEDLVREPAPQFRRVFEFLGCPFRPEFVEGVFASSIRKRDFPEISGEARSLCDGMMARLDEFYEYGKAAR